MIGIIILSSSGRGILKHNGALLQRMFEEDVGAENGSLAVMGGVGGGGPSLPQRVKFLLL